jgi:4-diphosphocytidyl-2-C-methyl-D-erythritol kinase
VATGAEAAACEGASAKINLFLHVTGRRADGYHWLDSLVVFAAIGDRIETQRADQVTLSLSGPFAAALDETDNLVLKAAQALKDAAAVKDGAAITLWKELPVASGIGGGSADAAATLRLLARLWQIEDRGVLAQLALRLGADVPVCLASRPARMSGIGEDVQPIDDVPPLFLVLVNPGLPMATRDVFARREGPFSGAAPPPPQRTDTTGFAAYLATTRNDLEAPALALVPGIGEVLAALRGQAACLLARLSGSGATCFGLFAEMATAEAAARTLETAHPLWWVRATPVLPSPPASTTTNLPA